MANFAIDPTSLQYVDPEGGNAFQMATSNHPRKRRLDTLFEESGKHAPAPCRQHLRV